MRAILEWLVWPTFRETRRAELRDDVPLVAHYWDGGAPMAHKVREISSDKLYLVTDQRWYPGTLVMLSLQREDVPATDPHRVITVKGQVVGSDENGVSFALVLPEKSRRDLAREALPGGADRKTFRHFLKRLQESSGQALIEYALILPLVFLIIVNLINFGGFFFAWITVANAARAGADYAILGGASVGAPGTPSTTQITTLIQEDASSLPNSASLSISVCTNKNGTITGSCASPPSDPEPTSYVLTSIDVTYTYVPFISAFQFPSLNIYATLPPTTIHRRAVMRRIQ